MKVKQQSSKCESLLLLGFVTVVGFLPASTAIGAGTEKPGVAVLLVDTDRVSGNVSEGIYGQFLEHINHSVVDGLFAEQVRGRGFEGNDFETYWKPFGDKGSVKIAEVRFENGTKSLRLEPDGGRVGVRQDRLFIQSGHEYNGSVWIKPESGAPQVALRVMDSEGRPIAEAP